MLKYIWNKVFKKAAGRAVKNSVMEKPSKLEAGTTFIDSKIGYYSYCGYNCFFQNTEIGRFTSIADNVVCGLSSHPMDWVSTSPAFYRGRDSIPKNMAKLNYDPYPEKTVIGSDVWIGCNVIIKHGITIGTGAVIGMGSIVIKNVPPYAVVAGNPAREIKKRFSEEMIELLLSSKWWDRDISQINKNSHLMDQPQKFVNAMEE